MQCATHSDTEARGACAVCSKNLCHACATYELGQALCCERCGRSKEAEQNALGSALLTLIGVGYLATLAVGIVVFKPRPFVGGLAALVAIALGRALQVLVKSPHVSRRLSDTSGAAPAAAPVDATPPRL